MRPPELGNLLELLSKYRFGNPEDAPTADEFRRFIEDNPACCERSLRIGHLTGSAWLVSPDGNSALLMRHRKLGRWLQPGGHADGNPDLAAVALREAGEETGMDGLTAAQDIFDLDLHRIPARGPEPAHWHYDMRFVVQAARLEFAHNEESLAMAWFDVGRLAQDPAADASIRRMALKWLRR